MTSSFAVQLTMLKHHQVHLLLLLLVRYLNFNLDIVVKVVTVIVA